MPINGFSVGRDITLNIVGPTGPLNFSLITKFSSKPDVSDNKIKGLDGVTRHVRFPEGWTGSFEVERTNGALDAYFAALEEGFYTGQNELTGTITETISEPDGSLSQYRFEGVLLKLDDAGSWEGSKTVTQKVSFVASKRKKVS
jgi:hypothetical protein